MDEVGTGRITVLARGWAFRRPAQAAAFGRLTAGDRAEAYLLSRVLTQAEAEELVALGWTPADLHRLVRFERPRLLVPDPVAITDENPDPEAPERRWYPQENRPALPRRNELPFGELAVWTRIRPRDRTWLAGMTNTEIRWLGLPGIMKVVEPYLRSPLNIEPGAAFSLARAYLPFTLFETVVRARGGFDRSLLNENISVALHGRWVHEVPEWETAGWISHPAQAPVLFARSDGNRRSVTNRWEYWHEVAQVAGPEGIHPALWWAAGFSPEEALRAFAKGRVPDRSTLEAMAVVRGKTPR